MGNTSSTVKSKASQQEPLKPSNSLNSTHDLTLEGIEVPGAYKAENTSHVGSADSEHSVNSVRSVTSPPVVSIDRTAPGDSIPEGIEVPGAYKAENTSHVGSADSEHSVNSVRSVTSPPVVSINGTAPGGSIPEEEATENDSIGGGAARAQNTDYLEPVPLAQNTDYLEPVAMKKPSLGALPPIPTAIPDNRTRSLSASTSSYEEIPPLPPLTEASGGIPEGDAHQSTLGEVKCTKNVKDSATEVQTAGGGAAASTNTGDYALLEKHTTYEAAKSVQGAQESATAMQTSEGAAAPINPQDAVTPSTILVLPPSIHVEEDSHAEKKLGNQGSGAASSRC